MSDGLCEPGCAADHVHAFRSEAGGPNDGAPSIPSFPDVGVMREYANMMKEMFDSYVAVGFTEPQAIVLLGTQCKWG